MTLRGNWELLLYKGLGSKYSRGLFFLSSTKKGPVTISAFRPDTRNEVPYIDLAGAEGLGPSTNGFGDHCSTS